MQLIRMCTGRGIDGQPLISDQRHTDAVALHQPTGQGVFLYDERARLIGSAGYRQIAAQAGAGALYLIHYPPNLITPEELQKKASKTFQGPIVVASDFLEIPVK